MLRELHRNILTTFEFVFNLDQNWTFHSRFDEAEMEQLFYFVLLQKTLKSCLAVMNNPPLREFNRKTEHEVNLIQAFQTIKKPFVLIPITWSTTFFFLENSAM